MFVEKYKGGILGSNSFIDRFFIKGSLCPISNVDGLMAYLHGHHILLKDFQTYSKNLAELVKEHAKIITEIEGAHYEYLDSPKIRKEAKVKQIIDQRGAHPGLVAVFTTLELDNSFDIQKDNLENRLKLVSRRRKYLHIYFYAIYEQSGFYCFHLQTFFPFNVPFYFNVHELLTPKLDRQQIIYEKDDNCINYISDFTQAQNLSDDIDSTELHTRFDQFAEKYVVILPEIKKYWKLSYHWSITQIEYFLVVTLIFYRNYQIPPKVLKNFANLQSEL